MLFVARLLSLHCNYCSLQKLMILPFPNKMLRRCIPLNHPKKLTTKKYEEFFIVEENQFGGKRLRGFLLVLRRGPLAIG